MMDEPTTGKGSAFVKRLLQSVQDEVGPGSARHAPSDDPSGKNINDEGDLHEAGPGGDIGYASGLNRLPECAPG